MLVLFFFDLALKTQLFYELGHVFEVNGISWLLKMSDFLDSYSIVIGLAVRVLSFLWAQSLEDLSLTLVTWKGQLLNLFLNDGGKADWIRPIRNTLKPLLRVFVCFLLLGVFVCLFIPQQKFNWLENFTMDDFSTNLASVWVFRCLTARYLL